MASDAFLLIFLVGGPVDGKTGELTANSVAHPFRLDNVELDGVHGLLPPCLGVDDRRDRFHFAACKVELYGP